VEAASGPRFEQSDWTTLFTGGQQLTVRRQSDGRHSDVGSVFVDQELARFDLDYGVGAVRAAPGSEHLAPTDGEAPAGAGDSRHRATGRSEQTPLARRRVKERDLTVAARSDRPVRADAERGDRPAGVAQGPAEGGAVELQEDRFPGLCDGDRRVSSGVDGEVGDATSHELGRLGGTLPGQVEAAYRAAGSSQEMTRSCEHQLLDPPRRAVGVVPARGATKLDHGSRVQLYQAHAPGPDADRQRAAVRGERHCGGLVVRADVGGPHGGTPVVDVEHADPGIAIDLRVPGAVAIEAAGVGPAGDGGRPQFHAGRG
jgi:hypothetical protein